MDLLIFKFLSLLLLVFVCNGQCKRLIKTEDEIREMNDDEIQQLVRDNIRFMDITFGGEIQKESTLLCPSFPVDLGLDREDQVWSRIAEIDIVRMRRHLTKLTSFHTRYYKTKSGREASEWVYRMAKYLTKDSPMKVSVSRMIHKGWPQFSVLCRIDPSDETIKTAESVILSAHLDSTSMFLPMLERAPGADDDGSGVVTQLEALSILANSAIPLSRPIEFIFFSAEEAGLLGSQAVVRRYQKSGKSAAILHIDMDGYSAKSDPPGIGIILDNTDPQMNGLLRGLIQKYSTLLVKPTRCGYACSDHYSWHIAGYPAACLSEGRFKDKSPHIHTQNDTIDTVDFKHMKEFVKIAIAYALHMTDPSAVYK